MVPTINAENRNGQLLKIPDTGWMTTQKTMFWEFKADLTHSQQLTNFVAKIDENQENVKKKEQVG